MYGVYDKEGILRFVNSDKKACFEYAELFELNSAHFYLINVRESLEKGNEINFDLNQEENNS